MNMRRRLTRYFLIALVLAGIIHIVSILSMPYLAPKDAWARLLPFTQENTMRLLPRASFKQQPMAFMAPDIMYAVCRYNVEKGPVRVKAELLGRYWSIALYTRHAQNYHLVSGADLKQSAVEITIHSNKQALAAGTSGTSTQFDERADVISPEPRGLVLIRAPLANDRYVEDAARNLAKASCAPADL